MNQRSPIPSRWYHRRLIKWWTGLWTFLIIQEAGFVDKQHVYWKTIVLFCFFFNLVFNWKNVALQYSINFCCLTRWTSHNCFVIIYIFLKTFSWSIVDIQCCVSFRCTVKWISYTQRCIHSFFRFFSHIGHYRVLGSVPYAVVQDHISYPVLYTIVFLMTLSLPGSLQAPQFFPVQLWWWQGAADHYPAHQAHPEPQAEN